MTALDNRMLVVNNQRLLSVYKFDSEMKIPQLQHTYNIK